MDNIVKTIDLKQIITTYEWATMKLSHCFWVDGTEMKAEQVSEVTNKTKT